MITTPSMGLKRWDQPNDIFSYTELSDNFNLLDLHDHTAGKGVQIPTGGLANLAVTDTKLANDSVVTNKLATGAVTDAKLASPLAGLPKTILYGSTIVGVHTAAVYMARDTVTVSLPSTAAIQGVLATLLTASEYSVAGKTVKLSLRVQQFQNNVAPAVTFTWGLYPLTIGTGTSSGPVYSFGTVVTGSTAAIATPAANSATVGNAIDFTFPTDGVYALGVAISGTITANSVTSCVTSLRYRHV